MDRRWRRTLELLLTAVREMRQRGMLCSINTTPRLRGLCFSSRAISVTKTRKKSARRHFYRWSEIYLHFRAEAHFKHGCCGSRRTRQWIIGKKREPRNEAGTPFTSQSVRLEPMTDRRL